MPSAVSRTATSAIGAKPSPTSRRRSAATSTRASRVRSGRCSTASAPRARADMKIGRYDVLGELARGGGGTVYRARSPDGAIVAVKVVHQKPSVVQAFAREERLQRLLG